VKLETPRSLHLFLLTVAAVLLSATVANAELSEQGDLFVSFSGSMAPTSLPRRILAPVAVRIGGQIKALDQEKPPQLRKISVAINRAGHLDTLGLPTCRPAQIAFISSRGALKVCRTALVGSGNFTADVAFPDHLPLPSSGRLLAFNATHDGHPVILAHVYNTQPAPTTRLLTFTVRHTAGTFGTTLIADLPGTGNWNYVTGLSLTLGRRFTYRKRPRSYLSAVCDAPSGFSSGLFPFARASMGFADGQTLTSTLVRSCTVKG
jgi:hypothetical protein